MPRQFRPSSSSQYPISLGTFVCLSWQSLEKISIWYHLFWTLRCQSCGFTTRDTSAVSKLTYFFWLLRMGLQSSEHAECGNSFELKDWECQSSIHMFTAFQTAWSPTSCMSFAYHPVQSGWDVGGIVWAMKTSVAAWGFIWGCGHPGKSVWWGHHFGN